MSSEASEKPSEQRVSAQNCLRNRISYKEHFIFAKKITERGDLKQIRGLKFSHIRLNNKRKRLQWLKINMTHHNKN